MKFAAIALLASLIASTLPATVQAAPGDLDPSFGTGGKFMRQMVPFSSEDHADAVAVQAEGKTVAAGGCKRQYASNYAVCLVRYLQNGALDSGFNGSGVVIAPLSRSSNNYATTLRLEGTKIVVANWCADNDGYLCLARFNADGTPDTTLNGTGLQRFEHHSGISARYISDDKVITATGCMTLIPFNYADFCVTVTHRDGTLDTSFNGTGKVKTEMSDNTDQPHVVTLRGNRIIVAGSCMPSFAGLQLCAARYNLDGTLDTTFNGTGKAFIEEGIPATSLGQLAFAVQPDGKILVGGRSKTQDSTLVLARLNTDGTRDTAFAGGLFTASHPQYAGLTAVEVAGDGRIAAIGYTYASNVGSVVLHRLLPNGTPDPQFGTFATPFPGTNSQGVALALTADGKLALAADCLLSSGAKDFCIARYDAAGGLDTSFNGTGTAVTDLLVGQGSDFATGVVRLFDGKLVIIGYCGPVCAVRLNADGTLDTTFGAEGVSLAPVGASVSYPARLTLQGNKYLFLMGCRPNNHYEPLRWCVSRMNPDGSMDASFGTGGTMMIAPLGTSDENPHRLLVDPAGKIMVAGTCPQGAKREFCFVRLNEDGSYDTTLGGTGRLIGAFGTSSNQLGDVTIMADGKIVAAGSCTIEGDSDACVARYLPNGTLDATFGIGGWFRKSVGYSQDGVTKVHVYANGTILLIGSEMLNGGVRLARFHPSGAFDTSFNSTGTLVTPLFTPPRQLLSAAIESSGKILMSGDCHGGGNDICMLRYHPDGQPDTTFGVSGLVVTAFGPGRDISWGMVSQGGKIVLVGGCDNGMSEDFCVAQYLSDPVTASTADFNRDNRPDLIWSHPGSGTTYLWRMSGLSLLSDSLLATVATAWNLQGVGDFNGDGHNDVVWRNASNGDTYVWYLADGVFQADAFLFNLPADWVIQGVADFNADGKPDFLMRNANSGNAFAWFFNNSAPVGDQFLFGIDPAWKVEGIGDFNLDGQPDLLFRNMGSGLAFAWNTQFSGGSLSLTTSSPSMFSIDPAWEVVQVADWNNDGKPDLLFRNRNTGIVFAWYLDGTTLAGSDFIIQIDPSWEIVPRR